MNMTKNLPITELATPEEKVKAFNVLLDDAEQAVKETVQTVERNRKFYEGDHHLMRHKDGSWGKSPVLDKFKWRPRTTTDDIYESISALIPILIRSKPAINVTPEEPGTPVDLREIDQETDELVGQMSEIKSTEAAESLNEILENIWKRRSEVLFHSDIILESLIAGTSYVTWQILHTRNGVEIIPKLLQRHQFLGDPRGTKWDFSDYRYCILCEEMTPAEIRYYYPEVRLEDYAAGENLDERSLGIVGRYFKKKSDRTTEEYGLKYFPVHTLYWNDVLPIVGFGDHLEIDRNSAPPMRQMIFINKKALARDRVNPFWHQNFPITSFTSSPRPFRADGTPDVSIMIGTQIAIDLAQNLMLANAMVSGSSRIWMEEGAIAKGKLDNSPGSVSIFNKGALAGEKVLNVPPGPIGGELLSFFGLQKQNMRERIGDSQGLLRGASPSSITSGRHAQTVLNAVLTRHGYRVTMLDPSWERMARHELNYLQQFVDFDTPYWRKQYDFSESQEMSMALRNLRYDVEVESKEDLPHDLESRINLLLTLLQTGCADLEEFYRQTGFKVRPELRESIRAQSSAENFQAGVPFNEGAMIKLQAAAESEAITDEAVAAQEQLPPGESIPIGGAGTEDEELLATLQAAASSEER